MIRTTMSRYGRFPGIRERSIIEYLIEVSILVQKTVLWGMIALGLFLLPSPGVFADDPGERRGEIGVQVGVRCLSNLQHIVYPGQIAI